MPVWGFHRSLPGWNSEWQLDPYDREEAKELLTKADYPDGFKLTMYRTPVRGLPEWEKIFDAVMSYFQEIGLKPEVEPFDDIDDISEQILGKEMQGILWSLASSYKQPHETIRLYNYSKEARGAHSYEHTSIDQMYEKLLEETDPEKRASLQQSMGEHKFSNYAEIPLFWRKYEVAINPEIVDEYVFPGTISGSLTHLEYVVPVPK